MRRSRLSLALKRVGLPPKLLMISLLVAAAGLLGWSQREAPTPELAAVAPVDGADATAATPGPAFTVTPGAVSLDLDPPEATDAPSDAALCPGCDVVLITVCSLRRDHVGAYGLMDIDTPAMDRIAAEGWRFERAYAASNFTLASLTAILTGRFGSSTGVTGWDKGLVADVPTLPEILGYYGYATGGFTTDAPSGFRPDYGLHRGFQRMDIIPPPRDNPDGRASGTSPDSAGGLAAVPAADWIRASDPDTPLFAMFHTRTAHYPFVITDVDVDEDPTGVSRALFYVGAGVKPNGPMPGSAGGTVHQGVVKTRDLSAEAVRAAGEAGVAVWRERYAEAVERTDDDVAAIWSALEDSGRLERTIVVLVADHGESLDDHGELLHGDAYFEGVVRVPLLIRVPGLAGGQTSQELISHVDLAPTLLTLVGALPPAGVDGFTAAPLLSGRAGAVRGVALVEGGVGRQEADDLPRGAVVSPPWTLLRQDRGCGEAGEGPRGSGEPATCLFDVDADAGQTVNHAVAQEEVVAELLERWDGFRSARAGEARQLALDPAFVEQLHDNGYDFEPLP